jgi:hypothetical protein
LSSAREIGAEFGVDDELLTEFMLSRMHAMSPHKHHIVKHDFILTWRLCRRETSLPLGLRTVQRSTQHSQHWIEEDVDIALCHIMSSTPPESTVVAKFFSTKRSLFLPCSPSFIHRCIDMATRRNPQALIEQRRKEEDFRKSVQDSIDVGNRAKSVADWYTFSTS